MKWDKERQRAHCLLTFGLLIALLGEFPEKELSKPGNVYLLKACVALHNLLVEIEGLCGVVRLTKAQRGVADASTLSVMNAALCKSMERGYLEFSRHRLDLYAWLQCWQCGYWGAKDACLLCKDFQDRPLKWMVLKESMDNIDKYLESYEESFPFLQEDGWKLYEDFLKASSKIRFTSNNKKKEK